MNKARGVTAVNAVTAIGCASTEGIPGAGLGAAREQLSKERKAGTSQHTNLMDSCRRRFHHHRFFLGSNVYFSHNCLVFIPCNPQKLCSLMTSSKHILGPPSCRASMAGASSASADADGIVRVAALGQRPRALLQVSRESRGSSVGYPRESHRQKLVHHAGAEGGTLARSRSATGATCVVLLVGGGHSLHEDQGVAYTSRSPFLLSAMVVAYPSCGATNH